MVSTKKTTTLIFNDDQTGQRVVVEDNGRVAYAYLLVRQEIVSDVWLYNVAPTPRIPPWASEEGRENMPFLNPEPYVLEERGIGRAKAGNVLCRWGQNAVDIEIDGIWAARLQQGVRPGWSYLAGRDGPLALRLDRVYMSSKV